MNSKKSILDELSNYSLIIILILASALPHALYFLYRSPMIAGFSIACAAVAGLSILFVKFRRGMAELLISALIAVLVITAVELHMIFADRAVGLVDPLRAHLSLIPLALMVFISGLIKNLFQNSSENDINFVINICFISFIVSLICSYSRFTSPEISRFYFRAVFPFTEASHYAIAIAPFSFFLAARLERFRKIIYLVIIALMAYALKNLTFLVIAAMSVGICVGWRYFVFIPLVILPAFFIDPQYYLSRLDFSADSANLSALVYRQAFEIILFSMHQTGGWGYGFQQLGTVPIFTPAALQIYQLQGALLNNEDAGVTGAKIIAEFGNLGIGFLIAMSIAIVRSYVILIGRGVRQLPGHVVLGHAFVAASVIELFLRGTGYFSGTLLLSLVGLRLVGLRGRKATPVAPLLRPAANAV